VRGHLAILFVIMISTLNAGAAATADSEARNILIQKLDKVQASLAPNDSSKVAVTLRLADLLSERARFESMSELDRGCQTCVAGDADRKKALRLYLEVVTRAPEASRGKVMVQIGHLYQMTGQEKNAIEFYQKVLSSETSDLLKAEANLAMGELFFKKRDFSKAESFFQSVVNNPVASSKGLASYRLAWCSFNMGETNLAVERIKKILSTPSLLNRSGAVGSPVDPQFHEEVAFDFVTFLGKEKFSEAQMKSLFELSPEKTRINNIQALALEQERLGRKSEAMAAWKFVFPYLAKQEDRLAAQLSMAQMQYDLAQKSEALKSYESALEVLGDSGTCKGNQCEELRKRARQFVINWHQQEKKSVTEDLARAYELYVKAFPKDIDTHIYFSQVSEGLKNDALAWQRLQPAIQLVASAQDQVKLESLLLKQLELGESSKDDSNHMQAMELYLAKSPKRTKVFEVQYQKTKKIYDAGRYSVASQDFRKLALDKSGSPQLRKQAADLALDSLVLLKDEETLVTWAREFAGVFKDSSGEFNRIVQKSILTKSAQLASTNQEAAFKTLTQFDVNQADAEDKIKYLKNKLILAEQLKKFPEAQMAADEILAQKNLTAEDREFAWSRKAYVAELLLDFRTALASVEKVEKTFKEEEKYLKMAIFAELSGTNPEPFYQKYLTLSKDDANKQLVAAELVRKAKNAEQVFDKYSAILVKNSILYAQLGAEIYSKQSSDKLLQRMLKDSAVAATEPGKLLQRVVFLNKFKTIQAKASQFKIDPSSDSKLAKSIRTWAAFIDQVEDLTKQAIQMGDWTSQLVSLSLLGQETERFYSQLLSAPVPAGLNPEEEQQYLSLLSSQAAPYQTKATTAKIKVEEFWKNPNWEASLKAAWTNRALRPLIQVEMDSLKSMAPEKSQQIAATQIEVIAPAPQKPAMAVVQEARKKVYQNPLDKSALEELLSIEKKTENTPMVQYLETRIANLGNTSSNKETK
jgi:tetratricopeptide (TPR) repeat protein